MTDLLALIGRDTQLKRTSACGGGEYSGPCPICRLGTDRFKVWPRRGRWACLGANAGRGGCDLGGDAIQYLIERDGVTFREACGRLGIEGNLSARADDTGFARPPVEPAAPPNRRWQAHARGLAARCEAILWSAQGEAAWAYLQRRGLGEDVLRAFHVGYNPQERYEEHEEWGLDRPDDPRRRVWVPRGITFPWFADGELWRLNVRRPLSRAQIAGGEAKYIGPAGFGNALYNADALSHADGLDDARPAVLVEGEIDALTIVQACAGTAAAVATGSTAGSRREPWIGRLAAAPLVLVAFDHDAALSGELQGAGDKAAAWWLHRLPNARRWQPPLHDINTSPDPAAVACWVAGGLAAYSGH